MKKNILDLIEISQYYGKDKEFITGSNGNTSCKDQKYLYVKASAAELKNITEKEFIKIDRCLLNEMMVKTYPENSVLCDKLFGEDLLKSCMDKGMKLLPSIDALLHHLINYTFVVHAHPAYINTLLCNKNSERKVKELFSEDVLYVNYCNPGYNLFKTIENEMSSFRKKFSCDPKIILIQNYGAIISADSIDEIKKLYDFVLNKVRAEIKIHFSLETLSPHTKVISVLPAIRMLLSDSGIKLAKVRNNSLIEHFVKNSRNAELVSLPFTADQIFYCKPRPLYIESRGDTPEIIEEFTLKLQNYKSKYGYSPTIILINEIGLIAIDENTKMIDFLLDTFENLMKISYLSQTFGPPHFLTDEQISTIEKQESDNYMQKTTCDAIEGKIANKIVVITGAAQGFGNGIAEDMFNEDANVVIADLNEENGIEFADKLNRRAGKNKAIFIKTDVSDAPSVENLIFETVKEFGGIDVFISNAGILHAGNLDEISPETFETITKVNYTGYFLCVKYASVVLKLQSKYKKDYFTDIIQINSKSGLRGSKKNFTYSGGKFGGVGLTQSFALELIEYNIKVNSICPGNFFDGPLWADTENGLFVQYLRAGKVAGAKTIEDVKKYYESQIPAKRGCTIKDVMKAVYYVIEQVYETGQAIPVTGGQVMIN